MRDGNRVEIKAHTSQAATMIAAKGWGQVTNLLSVRSKMLVQR